MREGGFRQEVSYRGAHGGGEWGATYGDGLSVDEEVGGAGVARVWGVGLVRGDGRGAGGVHGHCMAG